jgi:hypothetical protein
MTYITKVHASPHAVDRDAKAEEVTTSEILLVEFRALVNDVRTSEDKRWIEKSTASRNCP